TRGRRNRYRSVSVWKIAVPVQSVAAEVCHVDLGAKVSNLVPRWYAAGFPAFAFDLTAQQSSNQLPCLFVAHDGRLATLDKRRERVNPALFNKLSNSSIYNGIAADWVVLHGATIGTTVLSVT